MSGADNGAVPVGTIWHLRLSEPPRPIEPRLPAVFSQLGPEAEAELNRAMTQPDPAEVRRRFAEGRRCYAARAQGRLAAYGWVSFGDETVGELGLRVRLLPDEAYIFDCATLPPYQRQGLYAALLGRMVAELRAADLQGVWIGADYDNRPSQAGIAHAGFTAIADLVTAPPAPGERRRRGWLSARPGIDRAQLAEARRAYLGDCDAAWLFEDAG